MLKTQTLLAATLSTLLASTVLASQNDSMQGHGGMNHGAMEQGTMGQSTTSKMFLEKRDINGYTVSFHVMKAEPGMQHGGSHNLMVKVEKGANVVTNLNANSKVVYPDGSDESKPLMKMGDWLMAGYDLKTNGKHQLMVLFKTPDGNKHFGGVHYNN